MPNLRVVYNNAADKTATLVASTTAGSLAASNLQTDIKTEIWRSTSTTATLTATWGGSYNASCVSLPFSNLTPTATMRVQCYTLSGDSSAVLDTGNVLCCAANTGFVPTFGGTYATVWFAQTSVQKIVITITDTANTAGYVQAGRLVIGTYWTPDRDPESDSVKLTMQDDSKPFRSESGNLWTDRGPMYKKLSLDLQVMTQNDRNAIWRIVAGNGLTTSFFMSVMAQSSDAMEEQLHSVYGRLSTSSAIQYKYQHLSATSLQLEEA